MDNDLNEHQNELIKMNITHVRVLHDFRGSNNDELCMKKDDIITLTQTPTGGWWEGTLDGNTGWFPENYTTPHPNSVEDGVENVDFASLDFIANGSGSEPQSGHFMGDNTSIGADAEFDGISENRSIVIKDIHRSEGKFIESIQDAINHLLKPLHQAKIFPSDVEMNAVLRSITEICSVHHRFLTSLEKLESVHPKESRIGGLFLKFAPQLKASHFEYCQYHSKFVQLIEQHKKEICDFFAQTPVPQNIVASCFNVQNPSLNLSSSSNTNVLITSSLSVTFRRLDNYPALLQELQRYTEENHADRGDTQRAGFLYREIAMSCLELRRRKEMELEVLLGNIRNFDGLNIESYGNIQKMEPVSIMILPPWSEHKKDCFLVLFSNVLMVLSVGNEMTSFSYESMLQLQNAMMPVVNFNQIENNEDFRLEVQGNSAHPLSEPDLVLTYMVQFASQDVWKEWYQLLSKKIRLIRASGIEQNFVTSSSSSSSLRMSANNPNSSPLLASSSSSISSPQSSGQLLSPKKSFSNVVRPSSSPPLPPIPPLPQHRITAALVNEHNVLDMLPKRTSYWTDKCLSSHVPHRPTSTACNNTNAADFNGLTGGSTALDHNEDMQLLTVIDTYCRMFGGAGGGGGGATQNKSQTNNVAESDRFNLVQIIEPSNPGPTQTSNWAKRQKKDMLDKSLQSLAFKLGKLSTSNSTFERSIMFDIYEQLRQIRNEMSTLSEAVHDERKQRKRLQQAVFRKD